MEKETLETPTPESTPTPTTPAKPLSLPIVALVVLVALVMGGVGGYLLGKKQNTSSNVQTQIQTQEQTQSRENQLTPTTSAQPEPDPTAEWEVYTNSEYGFSLRYPSGWKINRDTQSFKEGIDLFSISILGKTQKSNTEIYDGARLAVGEPLPITKPIGEWVASYYGEKSGATGNEYTFSTKTINGKTYHTMYGCGLGCFLYHNIEHNGLVYRIVASTAGPDETKYDQEIDQILSTFEFLD